MDAISFVLVPTQEHYHYNKYSSDLKRINLLNYDNIILSHLKFNIPASHTCILQVIYSDATLNHYYYPITSMERWERLDFKAIHQITRVQSFYFEYEHLTGVPDELFTLHWEVHMEKQAHWEKNGGNALPYIPKELTG